MILDLYDGSFGLPSVPYIRDILYPGRMSLFLVFSFTPWTDRPLVSVPEIKECVLEVWCI